jgi:hypothetical protein
VAAGISRALAQQRPHSLRVATPGSMEETSSTHVVWSIHVGTGYPQRQSLSTRKASRHSRRHASPLLIYTKCFFHHHFLEHLKCAASVQPAAGTTCKAIKSERESCLLVLTSVNSTSQWISRRKVCFVSARMMMMPFICYCRNKNSSTQIARSGPY